MEYAKTFSMDLSPQHHPRTVSIFGATGTIGKNTLNIIEQHKEYFQVDALVSHHNAAALAEAAKRSGAQLAVVWDESSYKELKSLLQGTTIEVAAGEDAVIEAASRPVDMLVEGIVGAAALKPTLAAIRQGTMIGLANKECLVCAGDLMMEEARNHHATILPIDSEHNALFQAFDPEQSKSVESLILTASGGPFRTLTYQEMQYVTPAQAIKHPNWTMGAKISVDSATMMNKGLEIIEAYHLFPVKHEQIEAIIHPESIIHGIVSYHDGSMIAGMSMPDMRVPIAFALGYPHRLSTNTKRLSFSDIGKLTFEQPDTQKFPALRLAKQVLATGGTAPCIFNAANEIAVEAFLAEKISFLQIVALVEQTLDALPSVALTSLDQVVAVDAEARKTSLRLSQKLMQ